jgi:hypothetical protein
MKAASTWPAVPSGGDLVGRQVDDGHIAFGDADMGQRAHQRVMRGRADGDGDALALDVLQLGDAAVGLGDQAFGGAEALGRS